MKAKFLALATLVLGLASCQQEPGLFNPVGGEVDVQLTVDASSIGTRADSDGDDQNGHDSAYGAIDYLEADWAAYDLRYTLEVYDASAANDANAKPIKARQQVVMEEYAPASFDLRLVPGRAYRFVVFADILKEDGTAYHVIGETLRDITIANDGINNEATDAYFDFEDVTVNDSTPLNMVLTRPYGKLRVVATDLAELNLNIDVKAVEVTYTATHPTTFNAVTGEIGAYTENVSQVFTSEISEGSHYTAGYDAAPAYMTLFTDYILARAEGQDNVQFTLNVYDDEAMADVNLIKSTTFNTTIPVERNHLTTVIGNVLTTATEINVTIDDKFAGETVVDFVQVNENTYEIRNADGLKYFRDVVNGNITRSGETFLGKTIILTSDINLGGIEWEPIGNSSSHQSTFRGTFDGQGHTISNFTVNAETGAGLFGMVSPKLICNLNVENATIIGHHYAGALAGWVQSVDSQAHNRGAIRDCHAKNVTVTLTPDANKDNGDKAGALVGYIVRLDVENCSVDGATVTAYRDCGGVVGHANSNSTVKNCSVANTTVVADQTAEYIEEGKAANEGEVVGRISTDSAVENNTVGENVVATVKVNSYEAILEAIAVPGAVVTIGPNPNTEDGSYDMEGKISLAEGVSLIGEGNEPVKIWNSWSSNLFKNQAHFTDTYMENIYFDNNVVIDAAIANGNVVFKKCVFGRYGKSHQAVHFDSGNGTVTFDECTLVGRNMLGSSLERVVFNKCTFLNKTASLTGADKWTGVNMWGSYEFNDCVFDTEAHCNVKCDGVVAAFNNCVFNDGRDITTLINNHNNFSAEITFDGFEYVAAGQLEGPNGETVALTEQGLREALESGEDIILANPFTIDQSETNGYGKTGISLNNGGTLDGNGNTLGAPGSTGTWDAAITTSGGTIKNISVTKGFRGIFIKKNDSHNEKLYLDNVTIDGTTYTISCDKGNGMGLEATNSTFKGWTSYAATLGNAKFTDCYFGAGNGYSFCRPYAPTEFVGCEFEAGYTIDPRAEISFENCTFGGVALTAENVAELVTNPAKVTFK